MELTTKVYVIKENMIYVITRMRQIADSTGLGFTYDLDLVAGYDYINTDESNVQGFIPANNFIDEVQWDIINVYPLEESLGERLKEEGYTVIDISKYKIHESKLED
ncbi:hypothetical protein [Bacillus gaemokensis]|uniref:Uncharacterized protein n=1 Tax=Bacillus gaemokensis TaxID=574375 RepID=A0A073KBC3_9BACI|nr:hypothetical protein [Bacillus gaemokensis]KEK23860.1 hypothetical protein BAGA_05295 [Bacillus gaemokensis]KYG38100.1 hypothetical protein AZF08_20330 [Bacillus gaemokensis]